MKSPLIIPAEILDSTSIINIVRYVKPRSCTSCELELGKWRIYNRKLHRRYNDRVKIKIIVESNNVYETVRLLSMYGFRDNFLVDSIGSFIKSNPSVSQIGSDVVMVVDKQNKVVLIGNPCNDFEIRNITDSIINEYITALKDTTNTV